MISVAGGLQSGQTVLVSGAAGAVGRCAVYMAKALGARVIAGAFIADAVSAGKMTIPIDHREQLKNAGAAQAAFTKGGIGKVLLVP